MANAWSFNFRILIKKEEDLWVAHCLELDLVAVAPAEDQVEQDIITMIEGQVRYCLANDNMDYLFRSAPKEVWDEYRACEKPAQVRRHTVKGGAKRTESNDVVPPFSFSASACRSLSACHA